MAFDKIRMNLNIGPIIEGRYLGVNLWVHESGVRHQFTVAIGCGYFKSSIPLSTTEQGHRHQTLLYGFRLWLSIQMSDTISVLVPSTAKLHWHDRDNAPQWDTLRLLGFSQVQNLLREDCPEYQEGYCSNGRNTVMTWHPHWLPDLHYKFHRGLLEACDYAGNVVRHKHHRAMHIRILGKKKTNVMV